MADSTEAAPVTAAQVPEPNTPSASVELPVSATGEEFQFLRDIVRSLPPLAVKDLLSNGVCPRCIFRLFGIQEHIYSCSSLSQSILSSILEELTDPMRSMVDNDFSKKEESSIPPKESGVELEICRICLGIMQFVYCDDKETLVKKDAAKDFASSIAQVVKQEGYQIDNFSLEVSVPPIIVENENAVWLYMKKKYGSETWFEERSRSVLTSAKDVLKFSIADSLETLLDVKSGPGSFRIRLTYTHPKASNTVTCYSSMSNAGGKRQKTGMENSLDIIDEPMVARIKHSEFSTSKTDAVTEGSLNGSQDHKSSECFKFPKDKVNEPCRLAFLCNRASIYFGGRYLKYSRNVSQTRWIIDDERMGEASVEEILGGNILPMCRGDSYKFHAAGREDIDVRMLGSGRPFLVEILNARLVPSQVLAKQIEEKINMENKLVQVKNLKEVGSEGWTLMREGESEKQKQYAALVWISRPLEDKDLQSLSSFKDMQILQRTPVRVLHRRSPLERERIIHWMKVEKIAESSQYFVLHLGTQAGTYIKEFVHGDLGRTTPSIGSILGCRAEILQLDVTDVKMDCFLTEF